MSLPVEIPTEQLPLFPVMDSLDTVVNYAKACVPVTSPNTISTLLMIYHNTLLQTLKEQGKLK